MDREPERAAVGAESEEPNGASVMAFRSPGLSASGVDFPVLHGNGSDCSGLDAVHGADHTRRDSLVTGQCSELTIKLRSGDGGSGLPWTDWPDCTP